MRHLRHKGEIQKTRDVPGKNSYGEADLSSPDSWIPFLFRWFEVYDAGSREVFRARQQEATISTILKTRWDKEIAKVTPQMRIKLNGRVLNVKSARNVGEGNHTMMLECTESL